MDEIRDGGMDALFKLLYNILSQMIMKTNVVIIIDSANWLESERNVAEFRTLYDRLTFMIAQFRQPGDHRLKVIFAFPQRSECAALWGSDHLAIDVTDDLIDLACTVDVPQTADDLQSLWADHADGKPSGERGSVSG